eukprot:COSAG05_NODE_4711_length_1401_cov_16.055300_2_plen_53_part_00
MGCELVATLEHTKVVLVALDSQYIATIASRLYAIPGDASQCPAASHGDYAIP